MVTHYGWTANEQQEILDVKKSFNTPTPRIKLAIVKKVAQAVVKVLGAKMASKSVTDIVNFLTDFEGDIQTGIQSFLVQKLHFNSDVAYWTAKTVMFLVF